MANGAESNAIRFEQVLREELDQITARREEPPWEFLGQDREQQALDRAVAAVAQLDGAVGQPEVLFAILRKQRQHAPLTPEEKDLMDAFLVKWREQCQRAIQEVEHLRDVQTKARQ